MPILVAMSPFGARKEPRTATVTLPLGPFSTALLQPFRLALRVRGEARRLFAQDP
jgi:hypothetical protein